MRRNSPPWPAPRAGPHPQGPIALPLLPVCQLHGPRRCSSGLSELPAAPRHSLRPAPASRASQRRSGAPLRRLLGSLLPSPRRPLQAPHQDGTDLHPPQFHPSPCGSSMHLAAHLFLPPVVPLRNPERPDRTRRPGRDESDPPVCRPSFGTPLPSPFHSSFHVRAGVAPGRTDPCGKAQRPSRTVWAAAAERLDKAARLRIESAELQRAAAEDLAAQAAILRLHTSNPVRS